MFLYTRVVFSLIILQIYPCNNAIYLSDILHLSDTGEKWEYNGTIHQLFIDSEKACDSGEKHCSIFTMNLVYLRN